MFCWLLSLVMTVASSSVPHPQHISDSWRTEGAGGDVVLLSGTRDVLVNWGELTLRSGEILTAGSAKCLSLCDRYTASHLVEGRLPYLDSSVVIGYRSDLRVVLTDCYSLEAAQWVLSELYLSAEPGGGVRVLGTAVLTNMNYRTIRLEFHDTSNSLVIEGTSPHLLLLSHKALFPTKRLFGELGRYVGGGITKSSCDFCTQVPATPQSSLFIVVYIEEHYPFLGNLLRSIDNIEQDKGGVELVVLALADIDILQSWRPHGFRSFTLLEVGSEEEPPSRQHFLELFTQSDRDYFVYIDGSVYITPGTLPQLVLYQKPLISPMLLRRDGTAWSNFWGSYTPSWDYQRSSDYDNIVTRTVRGVIPAFCLRNIYIIRRDIALKMSSWNIYDNHLEADISFCKTLNEKGVPMFVSNVMDYGWLKKNETQADLLLFEEYSDDWKMKYFIKSELNPEVFSSPCKNVYQHESVFTEDFGKELVAALDHVGVYEKKPKHQDRPGFDMSKTAYNATLTRVILDISAKVVPILYPGYLPKHELVDSWALEVEGELGSVRRDVDRGHLAAYHVVVPLNPSQEGAEFLFPRQDFCNVTLVRSGDLFIFPGYITHQKIEKNSGEGIFNYLELSFDLPNY